MLLDLQLHTLPSNDVQRESDRGSRGRERQRLSFRRGTLSYCGTSTKMIGRDILEFLFEH